MITHAWRIIHIQGEQVLLCLLCDRYSWNPHDRANLYCGFCHEWLDIVPEDFRRLRRGIPQPLVLDLDPDVQRKETP